MASRGLPLLPVASRSGPVCSAVLIRASQCLCMHHTPRLRWSRSQASLVTLLFVCKIAFDRIDNSIDQSTVNLIDDSIVNSMVISIEDSIVYSLVLSDC